MREENQTEKNAEAFFKEVPAGIPYWRTKKFLSHVYFVFFLGFLHLLITLPLAYILNIWSDEASTLYTTENGLFQTFRSVFDDEKQAPLYFLILSIWREASGSIFFARIFSIIFSLFAIKFFYDLARKFFDEKAARLVTAFFALHPFLIWTSLEIRGYSLVVLLSVLLLIFFFEGYADADSETPRTLQIFYVLTAIVGLYTNYYVGFLLVANFLVLIVWRRWRAVRTYFLHMLIVGALITPLLWMVKTQLAAATSDVQAPRSLFIGLRLIWHSCLSFIFPTEIFPDENTTFVSFVRIWLVRIAILAGVILVIKKRKLADKETLAFGAICVVIIAGLLIGYFLLGDIYLEIRHAAVLFPAIVLFVALVLKGILTQSREDAKSQRFLRLITIVAAISFAALFAYSIYMLYPQAAKRGDWARVGEYLERHEKPDQPIVVFTVFDALNLPYHYHGVNRVLPDERFFNWGIEGEYGSAESLKSEINFAISKIPPDAEEIWLATGERCQLTKACVPLENFVEANYTIVEEKDFYKEKLRLLRKKQK